MTNPRRPAPRPTGFTERFATVNGVRLHYRIGGQGPAVILLHGYAETGHMWRPIMPVLAERHTVVVPGLRGAGDSAKSATGYDKKNMAVDIHELAASLRLDNIRIVGHDIGLMVAYAYAALFPKATVSGLTGIGGGILLVPLLLLASWADARQSAGVASAFVLVNSVAATLGHTLVMRAAPRAIVLWGLAVAPGGFVGAELGARQLAETALRRILAVVLTIAGLKLLLVRS